MPDEPVYMLDDTIHDEPPTGDARPRMGHVRNTIRAAPVALAGAEHILAVLEQHTPAVRAGMLLLVALQLEPCPLEADALQALLQRAKQP